MTFSKTPLGTLFVCVAVLSGCARERSPIDPASLSDPETQYRVGNAFLAGTDVARQPSSAVFWWQQAARQGFVPAQYNLAVAYASGFGTKRDDESAAVWYRRAAGSGFQPAQFNLALLHVVAGEAIRDVGAAVYWYAIAAENGSAEAASNLRAVDALLWNPPRPVFIGDQTPASHRVFGNLPGYMFVY